MKYAYSAIMAFVLVFFWRNGLFFGHSFFVKIIGWPLASITAYFGLLIAEKIRDATQPDYIITHGGAFDILKVKLYWSLGIPFMGLFAGGCVGSEILLKIVGPVTYEVPAPPVPANPPEVLAPTSQSSNVPIVTAPQTQNAPMAAASQMTTDRGDIANVQPSFDCSKATTPVDQMVCSNGQLAALDNQLTAQWNKLYYSHRSANLLAEQRAWLRQKNACNDASCVEAVYTKRIQDIDVELSAAGNN